MPEIDISFNDGLYGNQLQNLARECGDFIIRRSDGIFAYQLAVVTDDGLSGATEIVRGADLLSSTTRQIYLQKLLFFSQPQYYHIPMLLAPNGRRLSKRDRDLDLGAMRARMKAESIIGQLAFISGLRPTPKVISAQELASCFSWSNMRQESIVIADSFFK